MNLITTLTLSIGLMMSAFLHQDIPASAVPNEVKNAFKRAFVNPSDVEWEKKKRNYEADFELGDVDHSALFTAGGQLLMIKMELHQSQLPQVIQQKIIDDFPQYAIDDVEQVKTGEKIFYQVELDGPSRDRKVVYNSQGEIEKKFKYWD